MDQYDCLHSLVAVALALIFLELETKPGSPAPMVYQTIVHFDPEESFFYLTALAALFETIKYCRLGRPKNEPPAHPLRAFTELDTNELIAKWSERYFRWSMSQ